jgi:Fe-S cluster biogenesis protein NfuA
MDRAVPTLQNGPGGTDWASNGVVPRRPADQHGGPNPQETSVRAQVEDVIEIIRPAIQADGGDIILREVDEDSGVVTVELTGACVSCPASTVTMKAGIERIMKDRVPGVTSVVQPDEGAELGTSVTL